ncbi:MAG: chromosome segregation protein SMC, partial [Chloroflexi bacterium]|nr:chromosome segregation protein SMC [Chloroflexota bacterium]
MSSPLPVEDDTLDETLDLEEAPPMAGAEPSPAGQVPLRLKRMEMVGYKSFASRTNFEFGSGITAIIGPNGSGKSNVADAIRWVLGEQSLRLLRGRRTEDMIYSGSETRSRLGMAEVALTFENESGILPIDYAEVTISRRAYRSGENEYHINGSRVRLRDVNDLLFHAGLSRRTYSVVGQGLVDTALSLQPEQRRLLIEEAAGLTGYQERRKAAVARLEATKANLVRSRDILEELGPRVRSLQRQAQKAEEYHNLQEELVGLLKVFYGYRWRQSQQGLRSARQRLEAAQRTWKDGLAASDELEQALGQQRARQQALRQELSAMHGRGGQLHRHLEEVQRQLAVMQERGQQTERQSAENEQELRRLEQTQQAQGARSADLQAELAALDARLAEQQALVEKARQAVQAQQAQRAQWEAELHAVQGELRRVAGQRDRLQQTLAQLRTQGEQWQEQQAQHGQAAADLAEQESLFAEKLAALQKAREDAEAKQAALVKEQEALSQRLPRLREAIAKGHGQLSGLEAQGERLARRLEDLTQERQEGAGLFPGVRAVLRAARAGGRAALRGVVGTVASQMVVPPELETAVETALGSRLQDVIVETWADAEQGIAHLKAARAGRATFLPLDSLRPPPPLKCPSLPGVVGLASELVTADRRVMPAVELLLNHTVVAKDLPAARAVFNALKGGFQVVTTEGEIVRSSGAVTGGTQSSSGSGLLAREGEWRRLPQELASLRKVIQAARDELEGARAEQAETLAQVARLEESARHLHRQAQSLQGQLNEQQGRLDSLRQKQAWHHTQRRDLDARLKGLAQIRQQTQRELETAEASVAALDERIGRLQTQTEGGALRDGERNLALLQAQVQVIHSDRAATLRILESLQGEAAALSRRVQERQARTEALRREVAQAQREAAALGER